MYYQGILSGMPFFFGIGFVVIKLINPKHMHLSETWFLEGYIDFELQKYRLLAYLQEVKKCFKAAKLYPQLSEIVYHYNNLVAFKQKKLALQGRFPKIMDRIAENKLEIIYKRLTEDNDLMHELEIITDFSLHEMKGTISEGAEIYEIVEKQIKIKPVGIQPLYKNEGYLFIRCQEGNDLKVYFYTVSLLEHKDSRYKGIKLEFIDTRVKTLANTYEQIKIELVRTIRSLPNPPVYIVEYPLSLPLEETILPITRRALVKYL